MTNAGKKPAGAGTKQKAKKKAKLSVADRHARKIKADHIRSVRTVFRNTGFDRVPEIAEKDIMFLSQKGEFDDCFMHENLIVLLEYTTAANSSNISNHIKHKKIIFDKIIENEKKFIEYLIGNFPQFASRLSGGYHIDRLKARIVYCSRYEYDEAIRDVVTSVSYLDFPVLKYFEKVSTSIKLSMLPELLQFLDVEPTQIGANGIIKAREALVAYHGSLLPEEASGFPSGYKVVSFYADADALLQRSFVLRRQGWRGSQEAYQRMLIPTKIEAIRSNLRKRGQVAVNNIIVTLPHDVKPIGEDGQTVSISSLTETKPVKITLPLRPNSIGLIDGQHRLYSYYRTKADDQTIAKLRHQQNLLVTGVIYPNTVNKIEAERFEAGLFLTINSNQSSAPPELRQEIAVLLDPFTPVAISKQVMERVAASGPLFGHVQRYFYDKGKLKTSSIVNFGLVPLLKLQGNDSLFAVFNHPDKDDIMTGSSEILESYISFCVAHINMFFSAIRENVSTERWTTDTKQSKRLLTVTFVNSFLITMRRLIEGGKSIEYDALKKALKGFDQFDTSPFSSSQYNRMAEKIANLHFKLP